MRSNHAHHARGPDGAPLGLVHRDVAPSNVLVGTDGRARLIDFGIAHAHARLAETLSGQRKGRLDYMAPEQLMDVEDLDLRADVFSVGTLLWTALVGRTLFRGDHDPQTMERLLHMPIPAVSRFRPELPRSLDAIVSKALERDRRARFRDAGAMARALRRSALASDLWASRRTVGAFVRRAAADTLTRRAQLLQRNGVTVSEARPASGPGLSSHPRSFAPEEVSSAKVPPPPARRFARQVGEMFAQGPMLPKSAK